MLKVLVKENAALRRLLLFWFEAVPGPPPGLGNNQARVEEVLTTLCSSEPGDHVHITWSPALMLVVDGEKKSLPTDTLAIAPKPESAELSQTKAAAEVGNAAIIIFMDELFWL